MILTVLYPETGNSHVYRGLEQRHVNKLISNLSDLQDTMGEKTVRATVEDDVERRATVLDLHAGEQ